MTALHCYKSTNNNMMFDWQLKIGRHCCTNCTHSHQTLCISEQKKYRLNDRDLDEMWPITCIVSAMLLCYEENDVPRSSVRLSTSSETAAPLPKQASALVILQLKFHNVLQTIAANCQSDRPISCSTSINLCTHTKQSHRYQPNKAVTPIPA